MQNHGRDPSSFESCWIPERFGHRLPIGETFSYEKDGITTMVTYYEDDYGRFSYSIGEGVLERTCGPLFLDQLLHGDDLQYAIYRKERGEYAEPRPKDDTFTYEHTHQDGKIKEKTVKLYQGHASVNYSFVSIGKDDIWHGCGQCSGCRKSGKWGKEFTEALNNYLSTKEGETLGVAKNGGEEGRADDGTRPST